MPEGLPNEQTSQAPLRPKQAENLQNTSKNTTATQKLSAVLATSTQFWAIACH